MAPSENQLKSPVSVWFIVFDELCERFNYFGLRTIIVLYLSSILNYSDDDSTLIYHSFVLLSYFMPLWGAILADSYWGKFKTIIRLSIVYAIGNVILTGASIADNFTLNVQRNMSILGLILIAIGTGGIKPCVCTFGGEQFKLPEQQDQLATFFKRFLAGIDVAVIISTFFVPELRKSVHCFGKDTCFPLAFGVLSSLMIASIVIFILGRKLYVKRKPENNVIFGTFGCIFYAIRKKCTFSSSSDTVPHWLDLASDKYSQTQISDTKSVLEVVYIYIAYPIFWALYEQQGSRWTFQATLMNGKIDGVDWVIKPEQMHTITPLFSLMLILSSDYILFPLLKKIGIQNSIQKLILGCSLTSVAFLFAASLHYKIFGESTVIPSGEGQFNVYNSLHCNVHINSSLLYNDTIGSTGLSNFKYTPMSDKEIVNITLTLNNSCNPYISYGKLDTNVTVSRGKSISYLLTTTAVNKTVILRPIKHYDDFMKPKNGRPIIRILLGDDVNINEPFALVSTGKKSPLSYHYNISSFASENFKQVPFGKYNLTRGEEVISSDINLIPATIYTLVIHTNDQNLLESKLYVADKGNYLHIIWQAPQYLCMVIAEVAFIVTTIEFSYTQAPPRIKSFVSACYSMTQSIGNLLVIVSISALSFNKQVHEYLFFAGIMLADTLLLVYLGWNYKYKSFQQHIDGNSDDSKNVWKNTK
ncbi:Proton-dependent oligopeptide transporter family,Major facilitator superfamily domain,PTR2 family [Cinara cedri]|uniref:Proton-dependent oligopeptide transporter family,Major facilitator superfamily domain,PTR2 family n=1 Tax=Cinara cedri TaxID=506608 RepID=A0A5E4MQ70_9HEMI|nr:Proton-dependent oligopeptide transporter family,Major facilitator superfamily domain,PTR2 family [Cinara cedri]